MPSDNRYLYLGAVVAGLGLVYLVYRGVSAAGTALKKTAQDTVDGVVNAAGVAGQAVNPMNDDNIFNQGFNSIYQSLPGEGPDSTLGSDAYDAVQNLKALAPMVIL